MLVFNSWTVSSCLVAVRGLKGASKHARQISETETLNDSRAVAEAVGEVTEVALQRL